MVAPDADGAAVLAESLLAAAGLNRDEPDAGAVAGPGAGLPKKLPDAGVGFAANKLVVEAGAFPAEAACPKTDEPVDAAWPATELPVVAEGLDAESALGASGAGSCEDGVCGGAGADLTVS